MTYARRVVLLAALALLGATSTDGQSCSGDCDGSGTVTVGELVRAVGIALGLDTLTACPAADHDGDASVDVVDLLAAVASSLSGCPDVPGPTPTPTPRQRLFADTFEEAREVCGCEPDQICVPLPLGPGPRPTPIVIPLGCAAECTIFGANACSCDRGPQRPRIITPLDGGCGPSCTSQYRCDVP